MEKKLIIPFGDKKIIAEINDNNLPEIPIELNVYLTYSDGKIIQDICLVRPHYDYIRSKGEFETDDNFVDCLVWGDSDDEDYTNKYVIGVYEEEEE